MPLYRYECESCGSQFTILVRQQTQVDAPMCPECGSKETRRMVPRVAVQFKGSGYYKTDYARKTKGGSAGSKAQNSSKSESGSNASEGNESKSLDSSNQDSSSRDSQSRDSQSKESLNQDSQSSSRGRKSKTSSTPVKSTSSS